MKIKFIVIGKTDTAYLQEAISVYESRLKHYVSFELICIPNIRNVGKSDENQLKIKEGESMLGYIDSGDELILLDEKGLMYSSVEFSSFLAKKINTGIRSLVFVAGGAYGFSEKVYLRASAKISLSRMTFTHQMVRLIFVEQLYRAFTIMRNESYHHE
ncbi:MAG: 23S rRNA (pseudouridine(1915)-N(3))-methyltransferase RlmH [Prevotellaceae bacterium]|jgi:23S rRNA (pseudouridine1915-N3)-methyltransferase|nr:23S rRNA (pseudouridine(1915)-N(3))-methyltransferase RlmH [Prevotellaceae bacterium]